MAMASASMFRPVLTALRPVRLPLRLHRTLATATDFPPIASSSSIPQAGEAPSPFAEDVHLTSDPSAGDALGIEKDDLPSNLVFQEGEVDITDEVVKMFAQDGVFDLGSGMQAGGPMNPMLGSYGEAMYLPLSSLADRNPTLPSSQDLAIPLPATVFHQPLRRDILHRCVVYYLSLLRSGTASSKTRAEVAKSGRKLYRQKGTGKARAGSAGSGTRRGGGTIHGPHQRDFAQKLPRKIRQLGLHVALSSRLQSGLLRVVMDLGEGRWTSTRAARVALSDENPVAVDLVERNRMDEVKGIMESENEDVAPEADEMVPSSATPAVKFGPTKELSILFVHGPETSISSLEAINRSVRNIPGVDVLAVEELAAYEVLKRKWTVMDVGAVDWLAQRAGEPEIFEDFEEFEDEVEQGVEAGPEAGPEHIEVAGEGSSPREQIVT